MSRQLADLLVKDKVVSAQQLSDALQQGKPGQSIVREMIARKFVSETKLLYYLSQKFGLPSINLEKFEIPAEVIRMVPVDFVKKNQVIPIQANQGTLVVAICDPSSMGFVEALKFSVKMNVEAVLTSFTAFDAAIGKYYGVSNYVGAAIETYKKEKQEENKTEAGAAMESAMEVVQVHDIDQKGMGADEAPVITIVNGILAEAIRRKASDIHTEPYEKRFRVRMRVDGVLQEVLQIPVDMKRAVLARMKIMSKMDIAESRVPQDGRIKIKAGGGEMDFRVSSMPTIFGEKIVMRLLSKGNIQLDFTKLGFEQSQLDLFKKGLYAPAGMVLVTGPTGSGKTTTLYSGLAELNQVTENVSTVEDPVEYNFEGINQVQVNADIGFTFASVLRTLLRQDPDVILVGEIRDFETAEVSIQAALTGHLVLSTLHTNDAPSTVTRLMNMGVEPFLIVAAVNTIIAQRLVRAICTRCREAAPTSAEALIKAGFSAEIAPTLKVFQGKGCQSCLNTGYKGRLAIYEVMEFTNELKDLVLKGASALDLKRQAIKGGMKTLRHSALTKVVEGKTTLEEAIGTTVEQ